MSDEIYDDQGQLVQDPDNDPRDWVKKLRQDAKEGKKAAKELETLKRENVFSEAGIPNEGPGKLFRKAYDGDLESEAIVAAAQEYGVLKVQESAEPSPQEQASAQRAAVVTHGATAPPPDSVDEQLAATRLLPREQQPAAVREVMVRNGIWADTSQFE